MSQTIWSRHRGSGQEAAVLKTDAHRPIPSPPTDLEVLQKDGDTFVLDSFSVEDAWFLGHLLHARLLPLASSKPAVINISLANGSQTLFQCVTGSGIMPDNERWVQRKKNTVLRWGCSTWYMHCKFDADEKSFAAKYGLSPEDASNYAIHGGAIPIRVKGVEGVVAVVIVSGLKQHEDHGVIVDVIKENWTASSI